MDQERNKRVKVMRDLKLVLQSLKSRSQQYHPGDKSLQRKKKTKQGPKVQDVDGVRLIS